MNSKHIKIISLFCAAAVLGIFFFVYHSYNEAVGATKERFSLQQDMLAKEIALGIEENTDILINELKSLSSQQPLKDMDINKSKIILENIYEHIRHYSVDDVALLDSKGTIRFALHAPFLTGQDFSYRQYYQTARTLRTSSPVYEFVEFKGVSLGQKGMIIAIPLFSTENHFNGVVLFTVRINDLIGRMIPSETYKNSVWILDAEDKIIYHPGYSPGTDSAELAGKSKSLKAFLEEIHDGEHYHAEYVSPQDGDMIASFLSIPVAGKTWTVAVSMPVRSFSGIINHSTTEYAIGLLLISLIATGIIFMSISYNRQLKKSHDELELRVSERTQDLMTINEELEQEISNHVIAKASLRAAKLTAEDEKAKTEAILACMGDAISIQGTDFQVLYQNKVHADILGNRVGEYCYKAYEGRDAACKGCPMAKAFEDGSIHSAERSSIVNGHIMHVDITASPLRNSDGEIMGGIEIVRDITNRKLAQEALKKAEERYRHLLEVAQEGIWVVNKNDITTFVNPSMAYMLGYSVDEMLDRHLFSFLDEKAVEIAKQRLEVRKRGIGEQHDFEFIRKDGSHIHTTVVTSPILDEDGNYNGAIAGIIDITDRKKAEDKLKEAHSLLETLIEAMPYAVFFKDADGRHVIVNEACCKSTGHAKEDFLGKTCHDLMSPDLAEECRTGDEMIMREGKTIRFDEQITDPNGNKLFIETIKTPLFDERGIAKGLIGMFQDITWRKRIEEDLRRAKDSLSEAQSIAHIGNWEWDVATNEVGWSDEVYQIYGHEPQSFKPHYEMILKTMHPDSLELFLKNINAALNEQKPFEMDYSLVRPNGEERIVHTIGEVTFDSDGKPVRMFGTIQDITDKRMLEKEAIRSAQLASVGELAAGVAHEINNPINGIINYAQILFNRSMQDGNRDIASRILKEGDRISHIVKSLLSFARPDEDYRTDVSVGELLNDVLSLTGAQLRKEGIILETRIPEELPATKVNRQQIEQVFLNIINNSHYALNEKYRGLDPDKVLSITTRKHEYGGNQYVRTTFTDKGTGIPSHLIDKVTTTFFTTKPKGKGTGLGLSISQNIVNDHGGNLTIESKEGEFTTVNVDIPSVNTAHKDEHRFKKHR